MKNKFTIKDLTEKINKNVAEFKESDMFGNDEPKDVILGKYAPLYKNMSYTLKKLINLKKVNLTIFNQPYFEGKAPSFHKALAEELKDSGLNNTYEVKTFKIDLAYMVYDMEKEQPQVVNYNIVVLMPKNIKIRRFCYDHNDEPIYSYSSLIEMANKKEIFFLPSNLEDVKTPIGYEDQMYSFTMCDAMHDEDKNDIEKVLLKLAREEFKTMLTDEILHMKKVTAHKLEKDQCLLNILRRKFEEENKALVDRVQTATNTVNALYDVSVGDMELD